MGVTDHLRLRRSVLSREHMSDHQLHATTQQAKIEETTMDSEVSMRLDQAPRMYLCLCLHRLLVHWQSLRNRSPICQLKIVNIVTLDLQ